MATYVGYSSIGETIGSRSLEDIDIARRDLMNHFNTRKGERVMNPEFGSILPELVFEPNDLTTITAAQEDVDVIVNNDPRWKVLETLVDKPDDDSIEVKVRMEYVDTGTAEELFLRFTGEE